MYCHALSSIVMYCRALSCIVKYCCVLSCIVEYCHILSCILPKLYECLVLQPQVWQLFVGDEVNSLVLKPLNHKHSGVYKGVLCPTCYAYSLLTRANKLKTAVQGSLLVWPHQTLCTCVQIILASKFFIISILGTNTGVVGINWSQNTLTVLWKATDMLSLSRGDVMVM